MKGIPRLFIVCAPINWVFIQMPWIQAITDTQEKTTCQDQAYLQ